MYSTTSVLDHLEEAFKPSPLEHAAVERHALLGAKATDGTTLLVLTTFGTSLFGTFVELDQLAELYRRPESALELAHRVADEVREPSQAYVVDNADWAADLTARTDILWRGVDPHSADLVGRVRAIESPSRTGAGSLSRSWSRMKGAQAPKAQDHLG